MAGYRYATRDLSLNNAKAFIAALKAADGRSIKKSTILYAMLGKDLAWPNEPTPENPIDNEQYLQYELHRTSLFAKRILPDNVSHVIPRYDWKINTVYSMYRDNDIDMYLRPYYVFTDEYNVYKCLYNNKGAASTVKPQGFSTVPFTTSDGYTWKYMYSITLGEANKFLTTSHIPVKTLNSSDGSVEGNRQLLVQGAAVNGAIEIIETRETGAEYVQLDEGVVEQATALTLKLSSAGSIPPSPIDNFYNGCSVYLYTGTGSGQLRRIINYVGATKTLTVNTAFSSIANTDTRVLISPTVTIIGDGTGAKAYARVNTNNGSIANISVLSVGSDYTHAEAIITANAIHGFGASANVIISPVGGHGSDPVKEFAADKVMLTVDFKSTEGDNQTGAGYIPANTTFRTISILKDPVLKVNSNNVFQETEAVANSSNSPLRLNLMTRMNISYLEMNNDEPVNAIQVGDIITNERNRLRAEIGQLEFVTELSPAARLSSSLRNAVRSANANVVFVENTPEEVDPSFYTLYLNNVNSYGEYAAFTKDDILMTSLSDIKVATVETIRGPEANTFSGSILYTENIEPVVRDTAQTEDIRIILDF